MSKVKNSRGKSWTPKELEELRPSSSWWRKLFCCWAGGTDLKIFVLMKCFLSSRRILIRTFKQLILFPEDSKSFRSFYWGSKIVLAWRYKRHESHPKPKRMGIHSFLWIHVTLTSIFRLSMAVSRKHHMT